MSVLASFVSIDFSTTGFSTDLAAGKSAESALALSASTDFLTDSVAGKSTESVFAPPAFIDSLTGLAAAKPAGSLTFFAPIDSMASLVMTKTGESVLTLLVSAGFLIPATLTAVLPILEFSGCSFTARDSIFLLSGCFCCQICSAASAPFLSISSVDFP